MRLALLGLWFATVLFLASHHQLWRDEVRALSLALSGDGLPGMVKAVHGEGHPLLWYLLLRAGYVALGTKQVLPAIALLVATASAALLVLRSPFNLLTLALLLFGYMMLFEYSVMARNYGISMLIMFTIATIYDRHRKQGYWIGFLLFLLVNSNIHSVLLAGAFLLFWLLDLLREDSRQWTPALTCLAINAAIVGLGVVACLLTVLPTFNDAAVQPMDLGMSAAARIARLNGFTFSGPRWAIPILLLGSVAGLARHRAAAIALAAAILALSAFFTVIAESYPRHSYLLLSFATAIYWIALERRSTNRASATEQPRLPQWVETSGQAAFLLLLACQLPAVRTPIWNALVTRIPDSQAERFGTFMRTRPDLKDAVIMAEPDYLLESLPYYLDNPLYLDREGRFGTYVKFTRHARLNLTLAELLQDARGVSAGRRPVVILIGRSLDGVTAPETAEESYVWTFSVDPAQVAEFRRSTVQLGAFRPATGDEEFDAYLLRPDDVWTKR